MTDVLWAGFDAPVKAAGSTKALSDFLSGGLLVEILSATSPAFLFD